MWVRAGAATLAPSATAWGVAMDDVDAFLSSVVPQLTQEVEALHDGDVAPRMALWSHREPVSLFETTETSSPAERTLGCDTSRARGLTARDAVRGDRRCHPVR